MNRLLIVAGAAICGLSVAAGAQSSASVESAKAAGFVGERYDGYLGFPKTAPTGVRQAAGAINLKRRAIYSRFAQSRGVSPQEVGITAGCTLLGRVGVGEPYMLGDGEWRTRAAGQAAPVPGYCGR